MSTVDEKREDARQHMRGDNAMGSEYLEFNEVGDTGKTKIISVDSKSGR